MQNNFMPNAGFAHTSDGQRSSSGAGPLANGCCNAKTRKGTPCLIKVIYKNGRCKLHGGLSTGPKTKKGKAASRRNGKKGGRPKQNRQEPT